MIDIVSFALWRVWTPVAGGFSANASLRGTAEVSDFEVKCLRLATQLSSVISGCATWRLLACESGDDIINFRASHDTSKGLYKLLESQVAGMQREKREAVAFERNACIIKAGRLRAMLRRYLVASNHVPKRFNNEGVCLVARRAAAANEGKDEVSNFLRDSVVSMRNFVGETYYSFAGFC